MNILTERAGTLLACLVGAALGLGLGYALMLAVLAIGVEPWGGLRW